jgi:hypothetical protein
VIPDRDAPRRTAARAVAAVLALSGGWAISLGLGAAGPPAPAAGSTALTAAPAAGPAAPSTARTPATAGSTGVPGRSEPTYLDIPRIGVHAPVVSVGRAPDGTIEVPPVGGRSPAGWYRDLAAPGEAGPAVIVGHVDSAWEGPAVFYRLGALRRGDTISVRRADGGTVVFTVGSVSRFPKTRFPDAAVYGDTPLPTLRLITCGGSFDYLHRHYRDTVVVFADLAPAG